MFRLPLDLHVPAVIVILRRRIARDPHLLHAKYQARGLRSLTCNRPVAPSQLPVLSSGPMSRKIQKRIKAKPKAKARVFAALGDKTRLALVARLCSSEPVSISQLADDAKITRQAITKHLGVLERAGIVSSTSSGRERLFRYEPEPLEELQEYLDSVAKQWDQTQGRRKSNK
jgi:DNA-binding transcriptional ArsR family regulator